MSNQGSDLGNGVSTSLTPGGGTDSYATHGLYQGSPRGDPRLFSSQSAFHRMYGSQMSLNQENATLSHRNSLRRNRQAKDSELNTGQGTNMATSNGYYGNYSEDYNRNNMALRRQASGPYDNRNSDILDEADNSAFDYQDIEAAAMRSQQDVRGHVTGSEAEHGIVGRDGTLGRPQSLTEADGDDRGQRAQFIGQGHRPLRQTNSDTTEIGGAAAGHMRWQNVQEKLNLRRRIPQSDLIALVEAMGDRKLQRLRSTSRRTDTSDDSQPYIPSQRSLKMRTIEPPRRGLAGIAGMTGHTQLPRKSVYEDVVDLTDLFLSSAEKKTWGKQLDTLNR